MLSQPTHNTQLFVMPASVLYSGHSTSWLTYVGLEEQEKAASYRNREEAVSYAAQHTLMRCIAASALDIRPTQASEIQVSRACTHCDSGEAHGKPRIQGLSFNMARAQGMIAGAYSRSEELELGLDIEKMRGNYYAGFDNISLTATEKEQVLARPQEAQNMMRLMYWTGKQAVLKATGYGLSVSPTSVQIDLGDFPSEVSRLESYSAPAVLVLEGMEPSGFLVDWQVVEDFVVATASSLPQKVALHQISTPLEVKRVIQSTWASVFGA